MHERHMKHIESNHKQKFKSEVMKTYDFEPILPQYRQSAIMMEELQSEKTHRALQGIDTSTKRNASNSTTTKKKKYAPNMDPDVPPSVELFTVIESYPDRKLKS